MCGIAGFVGRLDPPRVEAAVRGMVAAQAHRGPDDEGVFLCRAGGAAVGLGQRRLAILDLSPAGHQPMTDPDGRVTLVFNGEVYNHPQLRAELAAAGHRFVGTSDTETLLHWLVEHGPGGLAAVEGMYAVGWVDHRTGGAFVARDPLGIKPLYYAETGSGAAFASEVRAVLRSGLVPRRLSRPGLATLFAFGAVQQPYTIADGVREFPPGHWGRVDPAGRVTATRFFRFPAVRPDAPADPAADAWALLDRAVAAHLMSDVPVGVLLSSGVDSRLVAAAAARRAAGLRSFTLGFDDHPDRSEAEPAAAFARAVGLDHTRVGTTHAECLEAAESWLRDLDQPSVDGLNVYLICRAVRRAGVKVALSGLGGDELFGGYPSFTDAPRLRRLVRRTRWVPRVGKLALAALLARGRGASTREKVADILTGPPDLRRIYLHRRRLLSDRGLARLGLSAAAARLGPDFQAPGPPDPADAPAADEVAEVSRLECRFYQGNMLLRDADANSMAHGLELRVPFLDRRLTEFALALPGAVKLPAGRADKHLLRAVLSRNLGVDPGAGPKRGFTLPVSAWLRGPLAGLARAAVDRLKAGGVLDPDGVGRVWAAFEREPDTPAWSRAFMLVVLGHYLERHGLS